MTTITIHLGQEMDEGAGTQGVASGGRSISPTASIILVPADYKGSITQKVECIYSASDDESKTAAKRLEKSLGVPIELFSKRLNGMDFGHFKEDSESSMLNMLSAYIDLDPEKKIGNGESFNDFKERVLNFFDELEAKNRPIAIVAPGTTLKLIKSYCEERKEKEERGSKDKYYNVDSDVFLKDGFSNLKPLDLKEYLESSEEESEEEDEY